MNANTKHINIFIAYSRKDVECLERLRTALKPLNRRNTDVTIWFDGKIYPGAEWDKTIKTHLRKAHIILLLVSIDALASDYFYNDEMQKALARHEKQQAIVIPVILRTCDWEEELGHLQALPKDGRPVTAWAHEDDAYTDIVRGVKRSVKDIRSHQNQVELTNDSLRLFTKNYDYLQKEKETVEKIATLPTPIQDILRDMIYVQGDTFRMGSNYGDEKPIHSVTLDNFKIGKYPVTQAQYQAVMGENPSYFKGNDKRPVEHVSWNDAQDFIQKLNDITGENFRLPTEAEWEFAARGGIESKGFQYTGSNNLEEVAWYEKNGEGKTHSIGTKNPNELNIHDMSGNVWEWCQDWYGKYSSKARRNQRGPRKGSNRVLRGGSWSNPKKDCRVSNRYNDHIDHRYSTCGFRVASSLVY